MKIVTWELVLVREVEHIWNIYLLNRKPFGHENRSANVIMGNIFRKYFV